jgi:hypothetical protein
LLVVGIFIYRNINEIKKENQTLDSELENYKKEVGGYYRQNTYLWDEQQRCVKKFNELADKYLGMKKDAINYEKMHSRDIYKNNYEKEYNQWKAFAGEKGGDIGKERKFIKFRKLSHTKKLMKEMSERYTEIKLRKEMTENDLEYSHSKSYFAILKDVLKKCALVIFIICIMGVEIITNPLVIVLWIAFGITEFLKNALYENFVISIVTGIISIVTKITGIIALGYTIISLFFNIGSILIYFCMIYFEFAIFIGAIWALHLYKEEVQSEQERIETRIQLAKKKITDWEQGSIEEYIEKLGYLVEYLRDVFVSVEADKKENKENTCVVAYWDFLFLGSSFLLGMENGLSSTFVNQCMEQIDKLEDADWRKQNEGTNE